MRKKTKKLVIVGFLLVAFTPALLWLFGPHMGHIRYLIWSLSKPPKLSTEEKTELHAWLKDNTIPLNSVEAGSGFEDMQPLKAMIGDAHIVALGEATHLVREFYQVKHRMVEFLVEEMEFTVFAMEATFAGALELNDYILTGDGDPQRALAALVYPAWNTEEVLAMVNWMREYNSTHEKKVKFYGFDNKPATGSAKAVYNYLRKTNGTKDYDQILSALMNPWTAGPNENLTSPADQIENLIKHLEGQRPATNETQDQKEWKLTVRQAKVLLQNLKFFAAPSISKASDLRDQDMADNVRWIRDYENGAKMILWAANAHVTAAPGGGCMGYYLRRMYGHDIVIIGLLHNREISSGPDVESSPQTAQQVSSAPERSAEAILAEAGLKIAVLDLRSLPKGIASRYFNAPLQTWNGLISILPLAYDALLFVESTTVARPVRAGRLRAVETLDAPSNLDFEQIEDGQPRDWLIKGGQSLAEYQIASSHEQPYEGDTCVMIERTPGRTFGEASGNIMQSIKASNFREKALQLSAAARVNSGTAYLWLSIEVRSAPNIFQQQTVTSDKWQEYQIVAEVPKEATKITYGFAYIGDGAAFIDDVSVSNDTLRRDKGY